MEQVLLLFLRIGPVRARQGMDRRDRMAVAAGPERKISEH
jgi:hypothetical protein